jgi:poly(3-hydroxyalkanoate) synthetase
MGDLALALDSDVGSDPACSRDHPRLDRDKRRRRRGAAIEQLDWASPNEVRIELDAMRLRDFSFAQDKRRSTLVVAPFALHDARIADLSPGSQPDRNVALNGCSPLFLVEWKSATVKTKLRTIDSHLCDLNVAVDEIGPPVDLIGLCQGGWR